MSGHHVTYEDTIASFAELAQEQVWVKVVDIGANPIDGDPPYASLLRSGSAEVVGFEPNPEALAKLNERKGPSETYLLSAVGDGRQNTLHICAAPGMTSLLQPNPDMLRMFHGFPSWGTVVGTRTVDTVRLDDVPETAGVDLIKMDIQGAELIVLRHAERRLRSALVIQSEVEFLPLYQGQPLFSEMEMFLRQRGFLFHRFFPVVSRMLQPLSIGGDIYAGMSQLVWADAIFVRDFTRLELLSDRQLVSMAAIVHDCYKSLDLSFRLLAEHDRRTGGQLASRYLSALTGATARQAA
jgi:FkbM family methyltransferase